MSMSVLLCLYQTSKLAKLFWTIFPAGLLNHFSIYRISLNNVLHYIMSYPEYYPPFSQNIVIIST